MPANVETMAYVGQVPWHGLGQQLPANPTVDQIRRAAGLTWEPELQELTYSYQGKRRVARDRVLIRDDSGDELDRVGPDYVPIKNREVLEFFREYAEVGSLSLETAGSLDRGRYVWCLAKMNVGFTVRGNDRVEGYVLLANPHIYGKSAVGKLTLVRVVCSNTLQMALAGGGGVKIWHTAEFDRDRRQEVQEAMGIAHEQLHVFEAEAQDLAAFGPLPDERAQALVSQVFQVEEGTDWDEAPRAALRVFTLYKGEGKGALLPGAKDTGWGLLNAVTQYFDHEHGKEASTRIRESWFGYTGQIKSRARKIMVSAARDGKPDRRAHDRPKP